MLTSLRSQRGNWSTSQAAPAAGPPRGRGPLFKGLAKLAVVLPVAAIILGCNTDVGDSEALAILVVDSVVLDSDPWGDVLTTGGTILDDVASVTFSAFIKGPITTDPSVVTPEFQTIALERYEVTFTRTDGGTAVPPGFTSGITGRVRLSEVGAEELIQTTLGLVIVPSTIKAQPPISFLISPGTEPGTNFPNIQVNARIQFFGRTIAGQQVTAVANLGINFANYGDENS